MQWDLHDTKGFVELLTDLASDPVVTAAAAATAGAPKKSAFVDSAGVDNFITSILAADPEGPDTEESLSQQFAADLEYCDSTNDNKYTDPDFVPNGIRCC